MKLFHIMIATIAVLATVMGAAAVQIRYSGMGNSPFDSTGYNTLRVNEVGVGSYGATWTPEGITGGWSARGSSGGFGYDYDDGFTAIGVRSSGVRGSWNRGYDGTGYGSVAVGAGHFRHDAFGVNAFGNAWGSHAVYYSQYGGAWGNGHNPYAYT